MESAIRVLMKHPSKRRREEIKSMLEWVKNLKFFKESNINKKLVY